MRTLLADLCSGLSEIRRDRDALSTVSGRSHRFERFLTLGLRSAAAVLRPPSHADAPDLNLNTKPPSNWEMYRSLAAPVYLPSFLMSVCQGSVLLTLPLFALDLGASAAVTALVFAMRGLGNMVFDVPAGFAAARLGDKATMLIGVALMACASVCAALSDSAVMLGAAAFVLGGAMSAWLIGRLTHISEGVAVTQRGKAIAALGGIQRIGNLVGPVGAGLIATGAGFETVFVLVALLALVAMVLVVRGVPTNRRGRHDASPSLLRVIPHVISAHRRVFATAGLAMLLLTVLRSGRTLLIPLWGEAMGLPAASIGLVMGAAAAADTLLFPVAGYLMDSHGRRHSAFLCMALLSAGLLAASFTTTLTGLCIAALATGVGNGLGSGINATFGADLAPAGERGEFLGVWRLMGDSGSLGGPLLFGAAASAFTLATAFHFAVAAGVIGVLVLVTTVEEPLKARPR